MELAGEGTCGGKVARFFHGKRPGARERIVHKSTESLPHALCHGSDGGRECHEVGGVGRSTIQGAMRPSLVVEAQIGGQVGFHITDAVIGLEIHFLVLDCLPQALDKDVVLPGPLAVHADPDTVRLEHPGEFAAGELATLIGVEDLRAAVPVDGFTDRVQTEVGRQGVRQPPGENPPRVPVDHGEQVEEAPAHQRQILRRDLAGRVVRARTGQPEESALMRDREPVLAVNHLLAGSPPALVSACSKNRSPASAVRSWHAVSSSPDRCSQERRHPQKTEPHTSSVAASSL